MMQGTVAFQSIEWWIRGLLLRIIETLTLLGAIIVVVNALQNVPKRRYISVMPLVCDCVSFWSSCSPVNVKKRLPLLPSVVNVFTSSFIAPTNRNGRSVEQKKEFDRFWSIYPRKVGKEEARKAWQKAGVTFEQCEATIRTWAASEDWQKDGGRFCPHASTWLNQKRWSDAPPMQCKSEPKPKTEFWPEMKTESVMEMMERQERERLEALENQYAEDDL